MPWTELIMLSLMFFPQPAEKILRQAKDSKSKQALAAKPKSKEYQKIEEKVRKIVADYYRVDANQIEVSAPISKQEPNAGEVTIVMVLVRVQETFKLDFQKEFGEKYVRELAEKLTVEGIARIVYDKLDTKKELKK
jgi:hypothetical protein